MSSAAVRKARWERRMIFPRRAVIDIGSNTVRLVVYEGPARAPEVIWNEKVAARLGRDLLTTGAIPGEAWDEALGALARHALIVRDLEVDELQTVATAAVREATNGAEFLAEVSALELEPRLLSGKEEARAAAMGAIGAFPGANGVVADLGGGSLELVSIADEKCHDGATFPLGTLRLPALRKKSGFGMRIRKVLDKAGWARAHPGPLYMVGGTWRALARYAMHAEKYPLSDPHGYELDVETALKLCAKLVCAKPEKLMGMSGIGAMRAGYLPDAAALLRIILKKLEPDRLIFSAWGLREGLLFDQLDVHHRAKDPLRAGIDSFANPRLASITVATRLAGWTAELAQGGGADNERYRLAAAQLSIALQRVEPNMRVNHATEWALDKRWIGCDARGKAMICAALFGSLGRTCVPDSFSKLASDDDLREALTWGLGFRLAQRLGGALRVSLSASKLRRDDRRITLLLEEDRKALAHYPLTYDLAMLADWLDLELRIELVDAIE